MRAFAFLFRAAIGVFSIAVITATTAQSAIRVATDIAPVHSLVAMITEGVSEPDLVIQRGASPHSYSLRPSEAAALERADVVFWMGDELTPWLGNALNNLAADAQAIALLDRHETLRYDFRDAVAHQESSDQESLDSHESHNHDEARAPTDAHEAEHEHDHDHDHDHDEPVDTHKAHSEHDDHAHEGVDPHAWLDPVNAQRWLAVIADTLAAADPEHAAAYRANQRIAQTTIDTLISNTNASLAPVSKRPFIVFHDAYQYFEKRFDLNVVGAIALSDARDPSPSQIATIQAVVREHAVRCVFAEPQFNASLVDTVLDGTRAETGILDPVGTSIPSGPDFYPRLIEDLAQALTDCLAPG
jgi:zinc transport system substrate-binding protein